MEGVALEFEGEDGSADVRARVRATGGSEVGGYGLRGIDLLVLLGYFAGGAAHCLVERYRVGLELSASGRQSDGNWLIQIWGSVACA